MYMSLLWLGMIVTAAGAAMVGFGIPINEFGLGNTLIVAGTTAFVGGLLLIGLAHAVRQLRRIADGLARPTLGQSRTLDAVEPRAARTSPTDAGAGRIPFPPKPEGRGRTSAPAESRPDPTFSIDPAKDSAFDRSRSPFSAMVDAPEPRAGLMNLEKSEDKEPDDEERGAPATQTATDTLSIDRLDASLRPAPPNDTAKQSEPLDSMWPADPPAGKAASPDAEPIAETSSATETAKEQRPEKAAPEPHAISILKSGVIDEMAYTLYSDGSIEAELPQGTMRFASIMELRSYLEKSS
jgi:hypothetical protein